MLTNANSKRIYDVSLLKKIVFLGSEKTLKNSLKWHNAPCDDSKIVELAPSGFDVKSFPRQSQSRCCGIATIYKSILGSNITFKI